MELVKRMKPVFYVKFDNGAEIQRDRMIQELTEMQEARFTRFYMTEEEDVALLAWIESKMKDEWKNDYYKKLYDMGTKPVEELWWDDVSWSVDDQESFFEHLIYEIRTME